MICRVNARRGTVFGRMIEARNWLRRIRVSKWSLNFVGPGFVASFKGHRGLVVHSDRPMEALPFWSWGQRSRRSLLFPFLLLLPKVGGALVTKVPS